MKVRYADPAADDLDEAITYFRDNVPSLVLEFATSIDDAVAQIADNAYLAQETENTSLRRWYIPRFRYSVFYTVAEEEVVILHIPHAARRWPWERDADNHLD